MYTMYILVHIHKNTNTHTNHQASFVNSQISTLFLTQHTHTHTRTRKHSSHQFWEKAMNRHVIHRLRCDFYISEGSTCMYIYIWICIHVYMYIPISVKYLRTSSISHQYINPQTHTHKRTNAYLHLHKRTSTSVSTSI